MLRSWHEARAHKPAFEHLDLVLVTSTDPENFLTEEEGRGSPFNVGATIRLQDFTRHEVDDLMVRHGLDEMDEPFRERLMALLGGHPFLTRRALYLIAMGEWDLSPRMSPETLTGPSSPFSDHLRHYLLQLQAQPRLAEELRRALNGKPCTSPLLFSQLQGAGLLTGDHCNPQPRCLSESRSSSTRSIQPLPRPTRTTSSQRFEKCTKLGMPTRGWLAYHSSSLAQHRPTI